MESNDTYYITWWFMWIGHLVAFVPASFMWLPAYFSTTAFTIYAMSIEWASYVGTVVALTTWSGLICAGIEWKDWKEIWVVSVVYSIGTMVTGYSIEMNIGPAVMWYMEGILTQAIEDECEGDQACIDATTEMIQSEKDEWEI